MDTITCSRRLQWCMGHRVVEHESKCRNLHGHNYVGIFTAQGDGLDRLGRVIDFGALKARIGAWIDEHWDHRFVLWKNDPLRLALEPMTPVYCLPANPTAENLASYLLTVVGPLCLRDDGVTLIEVVLWETENCKATARL